MGGSAEGPHTPFQLFRLGGFDHLLSIGKAALAGHQQAGGDHRPNKIGEPVEIKFHLRKRDSMAMAISTEQIV